MTDPLLELLAEADRPKVTPELMRSFNELRNTYDKWRELDQDVALDLFLRLEGVGVQTVKATLIGMGTKPPNEVLN